MGFFSCSGPVCQGPSTQGHVLGSLVFENDKLLVQFAGSIFASGIVIDVLNYDSVRGLHGISVGEIRYKR